MSETSPPSPPATTARSRPPGPLADSRLLAAGRDALARITAFGRDSRMAPLEVRVAALGGAEAADEDTNHLIRALKGRPGLRIRRLSGAMAARETLSDGRAVARVTAAARDWLQRSGGDVLIWGDVPSPGTTVHLRFVAAQETPPRPGVVDPAGVLGLPIGFSEEFAPLLHAATLLAAQPADDAKRRTRFYRLATAFRGLRGIVQALPATLTPLERATLQAAFADVAAFLAGVPDYRALIGDAAAAYRAALTGLGDDAPIPAAVVTRSLALALPATAAVAEEAKLREAAALLRTALDGFRRCGMDAAAADAADHLGGMLFRLEGRVGDPALLEDAVAAHRMALQHLDREKTPEAWADAQHHLARAAQVLGAETEQPRWLAQAVEAGEAALTVRTREAAPLAWAATRNTVGAALFLLGRHTRNAETLDAAFAALDAARTVFAENGAETQAALAGRNLERADDLRKRLRGAPG